MNAVFTLRNMDLGWLLGALATSLLLAACGSGAETNTATGGAGGNGSAGGATVTGGTTGSAGAGTAGSSIASGGGDTCDGSVCAGATPLQVSLGQEHGCAITQKGGVKCWGRVGPGQLGNGKTDNATAVAGPVDVVGLASGMVAVSSGSHHSCALSQAGGVKCWGSNGYGQLGNGKTEDSNVPVDVVGLTSGVVAVSAGYAHTCATLESGSLQCWGGNRSGELGDGTGDAVGSGDATTPRDVPGLPDVRSFAAGASTTCAVTGDGAARCWGENTHGKLGDGTTITSLSPVQVLGLEANVAQISTTSSFACAVLESGAVKCWGENENGQLGGGSRSAESLSLVDVVGVSDATSIQPGGDHACALTKGGTVKCWGADSNGQVGTNHTGDEPTPFEVPELTNVTQLSTRGSTNCVVLGSPSSIKCWGADFYGELGDGGGTYSRTPRTLPGF